MNLGVRLVSGCYVQSAVGMRSAHYPLHDPYYSPVSYFLYTEIACMKNLNKYRLLICGLFLFAVFGAACTPSATATLIPSPVPPTQTSAPATAAATTAPTTAAATTATTAAVTSAATTAATMAATTVAVAPITAAPTMAATAAAQAGGTGIKIGLVTDVGQIDDRSFNQSAWEGAQA